MLSRAALGAKKTSADNLETLHRMEVYCAFRNPFSGGSGGGSGAWAAPAAATSSRGGPSKGTDGSQMAPVNPWSQAAPIEEGHGSGGPSMRGVQRGNSAAMEMLRGSSTDPMQGQSPLTLPSTCMRTPAAALHMSICSEERGKCGIVLRVQAATPPPACSRIFGRKSR